MTDHAERFTGNDLVVWDNFPSALMIGENLHDIAKRLEGYLFVPAQGLAVANGQYSMYHVYEKEKKSVINPFERRSSS